MYAKIENDQVIEYPLFEGDLQRIFPEIPFPLDTHNQPVPEGYVRVQPSTELVYKDFHHYTEISPILIDGVWRQNFLEVAYTEENMEAVKPFIIRQEIKKRNDLLKASDWTQLPDSPMSTERREQFKKYRQELRDLTLQETFPFNLNYPVEPF
jgi:hypothetical protein